jgi:hypothetical protein
MRPFRLLLVALATALIVVGSASAAQASSTTDLHLDTFSSMVINDSVAWIPVTSH